MARKPRSELEPGIHHVFARGNNRQRVFLDDRDRRAYIDRLAQTVGRQRWRCLTYCLMPNHVHLLVETTEPNLGGGVQWLHGGYARWFNDRHRRVGHLFQGRFGSVRIQDDAHLWMTARYVVRNPVEAGLCERPEDWAWAAHASICRGDAPLWLDARRLTALLSALGGDPRERYDELAAD